MRENEVRDLRGDNEDKEIRELAEAHGYKHGKGDRG